METAVRKASRLDYEAPKQKHLQTLIGLTFQNPQNTVAIVDLLEKRLKENSWIIIFKVLITIHTLMNHGDEDRILSYIQTRHSALDTSKLRQKASGKGVVDIQNIYLYSDYLEQKVAAYRLLHVDYIKNTEDQQGKHESRLRHMTVEGGLLKDTMTLQKQLEALLRCQFVFGDGNNSISLAAFKLVLEDLLLLFQVINESIVNILEHYFEMNKVNARQSLDIYKRFERQAESTISFLEMAKRLQNDLNMPIPSIKHAPLSLSSALEEYLDEGNNPTPKPTTTTTTATTTTNNNNAVQQPTGNQITQTNPSLGQNLNQFQQQPQQVNNAASDFFSSIANERVNVMYNPTQTSFSQLSAPQQLTYPVQQPSFTGQPQLQQSSFTGQPQLQQPSFTGQPSFTAQPQQQFQALPAPTSIPSLQLPTMTGSSNHNPFRSSTLITPAQQQTLQQQNSLANANPFRASTLPSLGHSSTPNFSTMNQPVNSFATGNPFSSQQPVTMSPTIMSSNLNHNPFSPQQQQQQQQQQWGSSIF
ncbi:ANTH-domain-containing protein [Backusella circina FSU 941]|nr:ANTH-domain-containing protein [Backusella circina FSU 941]